MERHIEKKVSLQNVVDAIHLERFSKLRDTA